jgi:dolichol-phosphate mannosyltransferase
VRASTALVTGSAGFVGANLVRRLLAEGARVSAAVRPGAERWRLKGLSGDLELVDLDLRDAAATRREVERLKPECVFHLAAHGAYSWQTEPRAILETNVLGTSALLEACASAGVQAVVNAGSSSEYGFKDHPPAEDEALEPNSVYAVAKAAATHLCLNAAGRSDLRTVTLRLYSIYGPFEEPGRLIPRLIACGLEGRLPPLANPRTARDFVYVDDAIDAFLLAAGPGVGEGGAVYNVGSGHQTSLEEVVAVARAALEIDHEPRWSSGEQRTWDTDVWIADPRRIGEALGWRPRHGLAEGFAETVEWLSLPEWRARYACDAAERSSPRAPSGRSASES